MRAKTITRNPEPIISVKEARKLLGEDAIGMTNEELREFLLQQEQIVRFIVRKFRVHKNAMVQ